MPGALGAGVLLGFFSGLVLAGVLVGIGVPFGPALGTAWNLVFAAIWLGGGAVLAALSWRVTSLRFEADQLVITRPTGRRRRIPWEHVHSVQAHTSTDEDGDVRARWLSLTVRRNPDVPVPPLPDPLTLGAFREWHRAYLRDVPLGVSLARRPVDARTRFGRLRHQTRQVVYRELTARGFEVPD
jgi:hypothetical protein